MPDKKLPSKKIQTFSAEGGSAKSGLERSISALKATKKDLTDSINDYFVFLESNAQKLINLEKNSDKVKDLEKAMTEVKNTKLIFETSLEADSFEVIELADNNDKLNADKNGKLFLLETINGFKENLSTAMQAAKQVEKVYMKRDPLEAKRFHQKCFNLLGKVLDNLSSFVNRFLSVIFRAQEHSKNEKLKKEVAVSLNDMRAQMDAQWHPNRNAAAPE